MKKLLLFAAVSVFALSSCKKDGDDKKDNVFKSEVKIFQQGKAWTWYEQDGNKNPLRIGIAIDEAAMNSLDRTDPNTPGHHHQNSVSFKLPQKAIENTVFRHVLLDWAPKGHEPIYGKPHFDFHFYLSNEADRLAIPAYEADPTKFDIHPGAAYMPPTYIAIPGGVPQMGVHWVDATAPEIGGAPFTETFIMGSYDGKMTFYEPMITEEFILANPAFERSIPQPTKYQVSGWHPTKMRIEKKNGVTNIILEGFVQRQAS